MKRNGRLLLVFVLIFVVGLFAAFNSQAVAVNFLFAQVSAPLILVVIGSAFIGAVIATLVATNVMWQQKRRLKTLEHQVADLEAVQQIPETTPSETSISKDEQ
ncbi:LapA family protein [Enterococcus asini]|uniref:LapA family protein n=1 Tax=Enterococcus TaxID=1350 RepID=UPI00288DFDCC|nr:LapA family protein [Enterococcus asini]MDT2757807.1 LapA family protein [Enterococcus asini]